MNLSILSGTLRIKLFFIAIVSLLTCLTVLAQDNVALHTRTGASGTTMRNPPVFLTDGDFSSYCQPSFAKANGFYFEMDLEEEYNLDKIVIHHRLSYNYRVDIYNDNFGIRGALVWSAVLVSHGVNNVDIITADLDAQGDFSGRYIRITNLSTVDYAPSIFEIEVFDAPLPTIDYFETDAGIITKSGNTSLPDSANLNWRASGFDSLWMDQGVGRIETGKGEISLSPSVTTSYTLTATNDYGTVRKIITIAVDGEVLDPVINEFLASNLATIKDEDGDYSDWIEIYNPNAFTLNIKDYYLTDLPFELSKWKIPARTIEPKGYLVIFASSKNRTSQETPLHTNFDLATEGDYLALVAKDGKTVLQEFPEDYPAVTKYPPLETNVSYGYNAKGIVGFFNTPSPGYVNGSMKNGSVHEVQFYPNRGIFDSKVTVNISCITPDAVIRYTTDGSEPTATNGTVYSSPIELSATTIVRARAFKDASVSSSLKTHTYIIVDDVIGSDVMDKNITNVSAYKSQIRKGLVELPSISLLTDEEVNNTTEIKTSVEWIDPMKKEDLQVNAGIKHFGGSFTEFAKENFRLYFRAVHGDAKLTHPLFDGFEHSIPAVERFDRLDLRAGGHDMAMRGFYMSNRLTDDILLESGHLNPHGRYIHVFLNGVYWGQYHLRERWDDDMFAEYFNRPKDDFEAVSGNINLGGWSVDEVFYAGDGSTWATAKSLRENYEMVKEYVDVPQLIDFMLIYMYGNCESEFKAVGTKEPGVGFKFYFNDADGFTRAGSDRTAMRQPGQKAADGPGSIFSMLVKEGHPDFMTLLGDQIQDLFFNNGVLTPDSITGLLNERCTEVKNSIVAECARWGYQTPLSWANKKNSYIHGVLPGRTSEVISNFKSAGFYPDVDAPIFSKHGGIVPAGYKLTVSSGEPNVYYTIDGSDPRLPGGNVSEDAIPYTATGVQYVKLLGENANVSAFVPNDESLGKFWTLSSYTNTELWTESTSGPGVGYDNNTTYKPHIDLYVTDQMKNKNTSVYLRYEFEMNDLNNLEDLILKMKYDDGFVAYLNGTVIASANAPESLAWNSSATISHSDDAAVSFVQISLSNNEALRLLKPGTNVLAVHGLNLKLTSSDFLIEPELFVTQNNNATNGESIAINEALNIKARAYDGMGEWSPIVDARFEIAEGSGVGVEDVLSSKGTILYNYPNPFSEQTQLRFKVYEGTEATLEVYDMLGKRVWMKNVVTRHGLTYSETLESTDWQNGMYIYRLSTNSGLIKSGKMMHVK